MSGLRGVAMDFLETLYGTCERGWLTLWTRQDKKTYWFPVTELDEATGKAHSLAKAKDVYFGVGLRREKSAGRGSSQDVMCIPGLWMDIDVAGEAHQQGNLPPTIEAAIELLKGFPLAPSILVHSGHGLHGYWLFKEPWEFDSEEEHQEAAILLRQFQGTIQGMAESKGWKLDTTSDLARVLRVPGTLNHKDSPPIEVTIIEYNDLRYNPSDFEPYLRDLKPQETFNFDGPVGPVQMVVDGCKFIQHCRDHATTLPEPYWYAMITNLARAQNGPETIHHFSKPYPKYNPRETDEKIKHALEDTGPHTCEYIKNTLGFTGCPEDGCGVKAPVVLSVSPVARAKAQVVNLPERPHTAFDPEVIGALAVLKKQEPAEYAKIKQELKGRVNLNDLERAVNKRIADNQKLHIVEPGEPPPLLEDILPNLPMKELRRPYAWTLNENGIWQDTRNGPVCACPVPVILTRRLKNVDTGEEKVELAFYRDRTWHHISADRSTVFSRSGIILLADKSLPVSSESAKDLVRYLQDLERENLDTLPVKKSTNHMGWVQKNFLPGMQGDIVLDLEDGTAAVAGGYRENGTLEQWKKCIAPIRKHPIARFMLAASFAAPLLRIVGQRVFIIHAWGGTRGGKTAALKAALSVWGEPEEIMVNFNATKVGLERIAAFYNDLPLGIDERQVAGDKQGFIESLIYLLGLGKGKVRGAKNGGLQTFNQWRTIVLSTGEEPLSTESSAGGIKTRVLELYGRPIPNEDLAMRIHQDTGQYFGTAGPEFIRRVLSSGVDFQDEYLNVQEYLKDKHLDNIGSHITALAIVVMADFYASQWLWGLDEDSAFEESLAMGEMIAGMLETAAESDDGIRAYEYLMSWANVNINAFKDGGYERYGFFEDETLYIFPTAFDKAMKEGGFNPRRILRDWGDRGWIMTDTRNGETKKRYKIRKYNSITNSQAYFIAVKRDVL